MKGSISLDIKNEVLYVVLRKALQSMLLNEKGRVWDYACMFLFTYICRKYSLVVLIVYTNKTGWLETDGGEPFGCVLFCAP